MSEEPTARPTILLCASYWKEPHRWMVCNLTLADLWQSMGYRVVVVCLYSKTTVITQTDSLIVYGIQDFFIPDPFNFGISFRYYLKVFALIREYKPTHIAVTSLLFWSSWSAILLRLFRHKPIVITDALVGMTWWPRKWYMRPIMAIGGWTMGLLTMKSAHTLVTLHPQPPRLLQRIGVANKTQVIPSGINVGQYNYYLPDHTNNEPITITYVGRLESVKGVDDFAIAMLPLLQKNLNITVQIVGYYKRNHPLVEQYKQNITFTGLRSDIPDILAQTDIFILPSYSEGLSNALMEAMSSGCACIASRVGGNAYLVEDYVSGFLFTPGDIEALTTYTETLITDGTLRRNAARAARKRIEDVFAWAPVKKQYEALFSGL